MSRHEVRVSLNHEQRDLAAKIGEQMGVNGLTVVFMLLGGEMAYIEGRLDAHGRVLLSQLRAMLGVPVQHTEQPELE